MASEYMTIEEVVDMLRIKKRTIHRHIKDGTIKAYKALGARRLLFKRSEIESLIRPFEK